MNKIIGNILIFGAAAQICLAGFPTPEIDAASGVGALAAVAGAILIVRGRRKA